MLVDVAQLHVAVMLHVMIPQTLCSEGCRNKNRSIVYVVPSKVVFQFVDDVRICHA